MASKVFIYPYKMCSRSVIGLKQLGQFQSIKLEGSKFKPSKDKLVVNWGSINDPGYPMLNPPEKVRFASNKLRFFETTKNVEKLRTPEWTTNRQVAAKWLEEEKPPLLFARTVLAGHSGEGIVKIKTKEELAKIAEGTLIVRYIPKRHEFRIHVGRDGKIISKQQKMRSLGFADDAVDYQVRSHDNGFIFARNEIEVPEDVITQANLALKAIDLDFGAVDVIWNELHKEAYVLEVNTAPGLTGTTLSEYVQYFKEL